MWILKICINKNKHEKKKVHHLTILIIKWFDFKYKSKNKISNTLNYKIKDKPCLTQTETRN